MQELPSSGSCPALLAPSLSGCSRSVVRDVRARGEESVCVRRLLSACASTVFCMSMASHPPFAQVVDDLIKGQQFATQLQDLLRTSPKAGLIMDQILHTFSRAIHAAEAAAATSAGEWSSDVQSEVTDAGSGGRKRKSAAEGGDRRACRRKTQQSYVTKNLKSLDDGQAWRKYGQKDIQNCKHPKAYFRCTHKFDQLCMAQRQVQRCDDDSGTYKVTYIGVHTCQDPATVAVVPHMHHQTGTSDVLHAGYHYISFAPNGVATPATTTSTTTTMTANTTNQLTGMDAAMGSGLQSLKLERGDQEEVLSSNTPGSSTLRSTAGAATAPTWPEQGDVTSTLQYVGDVDLGEQFFDYTYLEDILPYDPVH